MLSTSEKSEGRFLRSSFVKLRIFFMEEWSRETNFGWILAIYNAWCALSLLPTSNVLKFSWLVFICINLKAWSGNELNMLFSYVCSLDFGISYINRAQKPSTSTFIRNLDQKHHASVICLSWSFFRKWILLIWLILRSV